MTLPTSHTGTVNTRHANRKFFYRIEKYDNSTGTVKTLVASGMSHEEADSQLKLLPKLPNAHFRISRDSRIV